MKIKQESQGIDTNVETGAFTYDESVNLETQRCSKLLELIREFLKYLHSRQSYEKNHILFVIVTAS